MNEHAVMIGARGWQHQQWIEEFYPEDIPPEWLLGYYGNEYPIVMVPVSYWEQGVQQVEEWREETAQSPLFICEWPAIQDSVAHPTAKQGLSLLAERVVAIVVTPEAGMSRQHWQEYQSLAQQYPLCFDLGPTPSSADRQQLAEQLAADRYSICWYGQPETAADIRSGPFGLCRLTGEPDPRALRTLMETLLQAADAQRQLALIIDGQPPSMQLMTNAGIMLDLL